MMDQLRGVLAIAAVGIGVQRLLYKLKLVSNTLTKA